MDNFQSRWDRSANTYSQYCLSFPQYKKTNQFITEIIPIEHGQIIVDLACGTGLTTQNILKRLETTGKVYALDFSAEMINQAKVDIKADNVEFIVAPAERISNVIPEKVDVVLCNSSFWQFTDYSIVVEGISKILKNDGLFVFNLNQQFYDFGKEETSHRKKVLQIIFSELRKKGYHPENRLREKISQSQIQKLANKNGLKITNVKTLEFSSSSLEDHIKFFEIPAVAPFFDNVPKAIQRSILDHAYITLKNEKDHGTTNKWIYFILKKNLTV